MLPKGAEQCHRMGVVLTPVPPGCMSKTPTVVEALQGSSNKHGSTHAVCVSLVGSCVDGRGV